MAQKKAHEVDAWLRRPDPYPVVLIYGPDHGLVAERAAAFAERTGLPLSDPFTVVRMDASEADESGKLIDEARTMSMFSAQRLIWVRNATSQKRLADDLKSLCEDPPEGAIILIEGGDMKKGAGMRAIVEASRAGMALPCYTDSERDLDSLIDDELRQAGLTIAPDARAALRRLLGGDRLATRGELRKLALYVSGQKMIELHHVTDLAGDVSELSMDDIIGAALTGAVGNFDHAFARYITLGGQPFLAANAAMREFQALRVMRAEMEATRRDASQIVDAARPPIHFSRKRAVQQALGLWPIPSIDTALNRLHDCVLETRQRGDLTEGLVHRALLAIAVEAARRKRN